MKAQDYKEISLRPVQIEGAKGVSMRWLISQKEAPNFVMRLFEVEKGGHTPLHSHKSEHEVFILEGQGELVCADEITPFKDGYVVYVEPQRMHQFKNTGNSTLKFLCLIPNE